MEKIQSAIAKARAARDAHVPGEGRAPRDGQAPGQPAGQAQIPGQAQTGPETAGGSAPPDPVRGRPAGPSPTSAPDLARLAAAWLALPTFAPKASQLVRNRIVTVEAGREATPFDVMRTRLVQQMRANNWRRVAITSPGAGCGKSMVTLNLGFSLARQPELHTLIAELDLRRPSLAQTLGLTQHHSFARVLKGTGTLADNAVRYGPNLAIATNHAAVRHSAELLHSATVPEALAAIEAEYDPSVILFDMPPMLVGDDVMAFMGQVDCALLVAGAESTTVKEIDICERELASQTNVLGVVLNKCRYMGNDYSYDYYG